jgi:hypothetical protein
MNPLPPLRTVRIAAPEAPSGRTHDPVLDNPKLPAPAREVLQTVLDLPLADRSAVQEFVTK